MQNVLVEMAELARQISAQMDTRASKLEVLLKEADQKIATLQTLSSHSARPRPDGGAGGNARRRSASRAGV